MITFELSSYDYAFISERLAFNDFDEVTVGGRSVRCILADDKAHVLLDKLAQELMDKGLQPDSELNGHGIWIEGLIDIVNQDDLYRN